MFVNYFTGAIKLKQMFGHSEGRTRVLPSKNHAKTVVDKILTMYHLAILTMCYFTTLTLYHFNTLPL